MKKIVVRVLSGAEGFFRAFTGWIEKQKMSLSLTTDIFFEPDLMAISPQARRDETPFPLNRDEFYKMALAYMCNIDMTNPIEVIKKLSYATQHFTKHIEDLIKTHGINYSTMDMIKEQAAWFISIIEPTMSPLERQNQEREYAYVRDTYVHLMHQDIQQMIQKENSRKRFLQEFMTL